MAYPKGYKRKSSTSKRKSKSPRKSPGALGGRQKPWQILGISKKQYDLTKKWGPKFADLPGGEKLKSEVQKRVSRGSPQDTSDIKTIARNIAGMSADTDKWVKTQAPRNLQSPDRASVSTQAQMAKKIKDATRDVTLMGEYPSKGDFQRARTFRSSNREPLAEGRYDAGGPVKSKETKVESVRKPEEKRLTKIAKQDVKQIKTRIKKVKKALNKPRDLKTADRLEKRLTEETMGGTPPKWLYKEAGGPVSTKRNSRDGYARGGLTKVPREDDSTTLMQAGGYLGGLTESGRGTMAGELAPRGSLPVREAGETMYERSRRRRGFKGGGAVSSYNRRYNNQNK